VAATLSEAPLFFISFCVPSQQKGKKIKSDKALFKKKKFVVV